ncbi:cellular tumor antigen p53 [Caerostris darwini]|uniref:Cellular tumor antigen p53 n=1 Tax=Caerostris darwini TaxID=1538125 RepID=A0AAV4SJ60_9ARAC|nr:cellular tumor antigen p53 [Caerostris darwini]
MNKVGCLVVNCNEYLSKNEEIYFYPFPEDEKESKKWLIKCGWDTSYNCLESYVCSRHFNDDDFERDSDGKLTHNLKQSAVPHLNLFEIKRELSDSEESVTEFDTSENSQDSSLSIVINRTDVDNSIFQGDLPKENCTIIKPVQILEPIPSKSLVIQNSVSSSSAAYVPSSLPASQNWPGKYDFNVTFGPQPKTTKGIPWTYSKTNDKLYVGKDAPCPINFCAQNIEPENVIIRATALYSSPEHASEIVHRCVNHSMAELSKGVFEAEHLVRCESSMASYEIDSTTRRHSVIVPYETPPVGQLYSTYIYKFACFGSCSGGPNRRPLMLIFSLEKDGMVVGRRKLDVKICACPGRDRKSEEQQVEGEDNHSKKSLKRKEAVSLADSLEFTKSICVPAAKKTKSNSGGPYTISVNDKECYDFIRQMKKFFEMCKSVNSLPPSIKKVLMNPTLYKGSGPDSSDKEL